MGLPQTPAKRLVTRGALALAVSLAFGLTACGGGGGSSAAPAGAQLVNVPVTYTVHVAPDTTPASLVRSPQYISTAIASVVFVLTAVTVPVGAYTGTLPGTPIIIPVSSTSNGCTGAVGNYTCVLTSVAPAPATDTWTIYTYATPTPTVGTTIPLSVFVAYSLPVTVAGPNVASVATWGVPASLAFSPASATGPFNVSLTGGNALTTSVQVKDAGGYTLLGGSNFSTPSGAAGTVAFSGCPAHLTATPTTLAAANPTALGAGTISVAYDGQAAAGTIVCNATAPGGLTATYTVTLTAGTGSIGWTVTGVDRKP